MIETKPSGALVSWSGGKDSCYAAMLALEQGYSLRALLNVMNESGQRSRSHGLPLYVLQQQAAAAGLPLHAIESSWNDYEKKFTDALATLRDAHAVDYAVFGDIDLQPHRDWEEKVTSAVGLQALLPLWQQDRGELLHRMLASGIRTIIVSCQERMGIDFLGKTLSLEMIPALEKLGVDPCGENGEFHTVVVDCPLFTRPMEIRPQGFDVHEGYCFLRWEENKSGD